MAGIREREAKRVRLGAMMTALDAGSTALAAVRAEALRLLEDWRGLLGKHVGVARQGLRKLLEHDARFVFDVRGRGEDRYYELAVKPTLERFFAAVPSLKKAVASPTGIAALCGKCRSLESCDASHSRLPA